MIAREKHTHIHKTGIADRGIGYAVFLFGRGFWTNTNESLRHIGRATLFLPCPARLHLLFARLQCFLKKVNLSDKPAFFPPLWEEGDGDGLFCTREYARGKNVAIAGKAFMRGEKPGGERGGHRMHARERKRAAVYGKGPAVCLPFCDGKIPLCSAFSLGGSRRFGRR